MKEDPDFMRRETTKKQNKIKIKLFNVCILFVDTRMVVFNYQ